MQISPEVVIGLVSAVVSAQAMAIAWLAKQLVSCYVARVDSQERALDVARRGKDQTERALRAGLDLQS